mgnify:CR=1 FL=1
MARTELTKMSPRGQVVIPKGVRELLVLKVSARFLVYGKGDLVILKRVELPELEEDFERIVRMAEEVAKKKGITRKAVAEEIQRYRKGG